MSFKIRDLGVMGYVGGMTLWAYRTGDSQEAVWEHGYFDDAVLTMKDGDFMLVDHTGTHRNGTMWHVRVVDGRVIPRLMSFS